MDLIDIIALAAVFIPEPISSATGAAVLAGKTGAKAATTAAKQGAKAAAKKAARDKARKALVDKAKQKAKEKAKEKAKSIAKDKLLGKKGSKRRRVADAVTGEDQDQVTDSQESKGGALAVRPTTSLVPSGPSGIIPEPPKDTGKGGDTSSVGGSLMTIQTKVVKVENLLKGSIAVKKKTREDARQAAKDKEDKQQEKDLESKQPKQEGKTKFKMPKVPGTGIFGAIWKFISTIILGRLFMIFLDKLPLLMPILKFMAQTAEVILRIVGFFLNVGMTLIDWGYKLIGGVSDWVGKAFGENVQKGFDALLGGITGLINAFLVWKIIGKKLVEGLIKRIKEIFNIAKAVIQRAVKFAKAAIQWAKGAISWAKNIASKAGKFLSNIPGVKNLLGKGAKLLNKGKGLFSKGLKAGKGLLGKGVQAGKGMLGKGLQAGKGLMTKGVGVAAKGASKVGGIAGKIFGKAAKFIVPALKGAKPFVSKVLGKIPILGPLVVAVMGILTGEPPGLVLFKTLGAVLGGVLGTAIPIPYLGTIIGETIGVFLGEMLYNLISKGAGAIGDFAKKIADALNPITILNNIKEFILGGFGRFFKNFMEEHSFKLPWWVSGPIKKLTGMDLGRIPNVLQLLNPFAMFPLLFKSFFPPKGEEKGGDKKAKVGRGKKKGKGRGKKGEGEGSPLTKLIMKIFKKEGAAEEGEKPKGATITSKKEVSGRFDPDTGKAFINNQEVSMDEYAKFHNMSDKDKLDQYGVDPNQAATPNKLQAANQQGGASAVIDSLEVYTEYEGPTGGAPMIIRPSTTTANQPMNGGGTKEVAMVPVPVGMGADPYEDLDFFG